MSSELVATNSQLTGAQPRPKASSTSTSPTKAMLRARMPLASCRRRTIDVSTRYARIAMSVPRLERIAIAIDAGATRGPGEKKRRPDGVTMMASTARVVVSPRTRKPTPTSSASPTSQRLALSCWARASWKDMPPAVASGTGDTATRKNATAASSVGAATARPQPITKGRRQIV